MKTALVLLAGGSSARMGGKKKELIALNNGLSPLQMCLAAAIKSRVIDILHVVYNPAHKEEILGAFDGYAGTFSSCPGGATRQASVLAALRALREASPDYALIHDGARAWVSPQLIRAVAKAAFEYGAAVPVLPVSEALKKVKGSFIAEHLPRDEFGGAQTPQGFAFGPLLEAHELLAGKALCDDGEVWAKTLKTPVYAVPGEPINKKITFASDLP